MLSHPDFSFPTDRRLGRSVFVGSPLGERMLPALLFGTLAIVGGSSALASSRQDLADLSSPVGLLRALQTTHGLLTALFCGQVAMLLMLRLVPRGKRANPLALGLALAGTFVMSAIATQPSTTADWQLLVLAELLLAGGLAFSIYATACLGRCFGLAPEARGLVTSGAYRLVRHPLYLGEVAAAIGAVLPVLTPSAAAILGVFCLCQYLRAVLEERVLAAEFPQYANYRRRTPALLPWPRPQV